MQEPIFPSIKRSLENLIEDEEGNPAYLHQKNPKLRTSDFSFALGIRRAEIDRAKARMLQ